MSQTFIIAIDFGTAFSGYAYCVTPRKKEAEPHLRRWGREHGHDTVKTPTCILFDQNEKFVAFGYEAKYSYAEKDKGADFFYFKDFKMELYGKRITKDLDITDVNQRTMKALMVFSEALRFLKEDALKTINNSTSGFEFTASDFTWVLTVPAIWDFSARQFMREAAVQAGIVSRKDPEKLVIALEPEAASVWCRKLPSDGFVTASHDRVALAQSLGARYIVVDCGGGTIDITVHEVLVGGALKELHKASGNDKGGQTVDRKFKECIREFLGSGVWDEYEREFPSDAEDFMNNFVIAKQSEIKKQLRMKCDKDLCDKIEKKNKRFTTVEGVTWDSGKILISKEKMESFFRESLIHITDSLTEILEKVNGIEYILLVGGFAKSNILCEHIRREFGDQAKVLCPSQPQDVIMKGAVLFGRDISIIRSRKSAFTYGIKVTELYNPDRHREGKVVSSDNCYYCTDVFKSLVQVDEDVEWNETKLYPFYPLQKDQTVMIFTFYQTKRPTVTYVDDWGVEGPVGVCQVRMPDSRKGFYRQVRLEVSFGSTEIAAKAIDMESKQTASVTIDFITQ